MRQYTQITPADVQQKIVQGEVVTLVDVRTLPEYAAHHISGVLLIPLDQFAERVGELDSEAEIICICEHGIRSETAARYLVGLGYAHVATMTGGMAAYLGPVERGL
jgi:rhodanese-related sulfurtransferase